MRLRSLLRTVITPEGFAIAAIVAIVAVCVVRQSFLLRGTVLGATLVGYLLAFLITCYGLKKQGVGFFTRTFYGGIAIVSAYWFFEILYHYSYPGTHSLSRLWRDLAHMSTWTQNGQFPIIWSTLGFFIFFAGLRYMSVNRWFFLALFASVVSYTFWIMIGYPQFADPEWWPVYKPVFWVIPHAYRNAPTEAAAHTISLVAEVVNSIAKVLVCCILPALFLGKKHDRESYADMEVSDVRRLKVLEEENRTLKQLLSDMPQDRQPLQDAPREQLVTDILQDGQALQDTPRKEP